jgi:hypothetical protein
MKKNKVKIDLSQFMLDDTDKKQLKSLDKCDGREDVETLGDIGMDVY